MTNLEIIVGTSIFTNMPVVGIALKGTSDSVALVKWADKVEGSRGRPAAVEAPSNGNKTEEWTIAFLRDRWQEWAAKSGVQINISAKIRRVGKF